MSEVSGLLRTPRWIALTGVALTVIVAFGVLSHWQWERAQQDEAAAAANVDLAPVDLASVVLGPDSFGRRVSVTGRYLPDAQRVVPRGGQYWVLTPLLATDGTAVAVVRGAVDAPGVASHAPAGTVEVTGRIEPYDGDPGIQPGDAALPAGQIPRITRSVLAPLLATDASDAALVEGWIALTAQAPPGDLAPVTSPSAPEAGGGLRWQNASYAVQWVLFAGFVAFLWWRWFRDDLRDRSEPAPPADVPAGTPS